MKHTKYTISLCPVCYKRIAANITVDERGAIMSKRCPAHGDFTGMLERDPLFYTFATTAPNLRIYPGHFVDITRTCQLRCDPCYYRLEKKDPESMFSIEEIVNECAVNAHLGPFILTGGEPTLHPYLADVITQVSKFGQVEMLSNGIKLSEPEFFNEIMPLLTDRNGLSHLHLSIHYRESSDWMTVVGLARADQVKIASALIVVRNKNEFLDALRICRECRDVVVSFRIKAASNIWNAKVESEKVFVSDMVKWLEELGEVVHVANQNRKSCFCNVIYDQMHLMLVSWHDASNVDLVEIDCPPTYKARNGMVANFVTAGLINEGMDKGWLLGEKIPAAQPVKT